MILVITSMINIIRVRDYLAVVQRVQTEVTDRNKQVIGQLRTYNQDIIFLPSTESILSSLDGADDLETGWWVVFVIGAIFSLAGLAGVVYFKIQDKKKYSDTVIRKRASTD